MRIQFNHIQEQDLFQFNNDYDPEKVIQKLYDKSKILSEMYNLTLKSEKTLFFEHEVKHSDIYCTYLLSFKNDQLNLDLEFEILIPDIRNSFCNIAGVRRYIQKQIRDTIYITMKSQTKQKIICDLEKTFTLNYHNATKKFNFNVQDFTRAEAIAVYLCLLKEGEDPKLYQIDHPVVQDYLTKYNTLTKDDLSRKMNPHISVSQRKRLLEYVRCYYSVSDLLQEYFESPADIIYQLFEHIQDLDDDIGLNLINRRVRTTQEMIYSNFMSKIIDYLLESLFIVSSKKRERQIKLEPFQSLYDFVLVENMFEAPLASVSNRSRCTICGEGGFSKDGVPVKVKNLHPTQYGCIDPAVTPDRDSAGIILYLASSCKLDSLGRFQIDQDFIDYFNSFYE